MKIDEIKLKKIICVKCIKGDGTKKNPTRFVYQYWTLNGKFLVECDDYLDFHDVIDSASL